MKTTDLYWHLGLPCVVMHIEDTYRRWYTGYTGVPWQHPLHGRHYRDKVALEDVKDIEVDLHLDGAGDTSIMGLFSSAQSDDNGISLDCVIKCHGGLSYSGATKWNYPIFLPGYWWLGFDCAHAHSTEAHNNPTYVLSQCCKIADQIINWPASRRFIADIPAALLTHNPVEDE